MAAPVVPSEDQVYELTEAEGEAVLEQRAQHYLHMSAAQFLQAWEAGEFQDVDRPEVLRVAMALPYVRSFRSRRRR